MREEEENMLEKLFHLKENKTTVKTEVTAGITSFFTMAYIIFVNPQILSAAGMDAGAVMLATCVASAGRQLWQQSLSPAVCSSSSPSPVSVKQSSAPFRWS